MSSNKQDNNNSITGGNGLIKDTYTSFKNPVFILGAVLVLSAVVLAYSNHFTNAFNFDDSVTIVNNHALKEFNIIRFITDGTTSASLPSNQAYRPYLTTSFALDYLIAGGLNPTVFHIHSFITFLLVCILFCVFVKKLLDTILFSDHNPFWALLSAAVFGLLCANAETVNYISQRAEMIAALYVLAGLVAYQQGGWWQSKYIYLLFPFIGFFAKENALVFAPLLLLYILIFEENTDLLHFYKADERKKVLRSLKKVLPAIIITIAYYVFYKIMRPETFLLGGGSDVYNYLISQPMVLVHYIVTFFVPYNLSADTDWKVYSTIFDYRAMLGILLILGLIYIALKTSKDKKNRLFSFGVLWFFIGHLPTSSFITFTEILNDHRSFMPYLGLTIAALFGVKYVLEKYLARAVRQNSVQGLIAVFLVMVLAFNAYGVHERNKVWKDGMSLWRDVTEKSPNNGRGLMNYGLMLMNAGDYANAEIYFNKALVLTPDYTNVWINLGLVKNATGDKVAAENNFRKATTCPLFQHLAWYYYGQFLVEQSRFDEAKTSLANSLKLVPGFVDSQTALMAVYHNTSDFENLKALAESILTTSPGNLTAKTYLEYADGRKSVIQLLEVDAAKTPAAAKYLNLSIKYFQLQNYEQCIVSAQRAIALKSDYADAYNNMGVAYQNLKQYDKAIEAYKKALSINPGFDLAKNNLAVTEALASGRNPLSQMPAATADEYLNLSVTYYNEGNFEKCIEAAARSIALQPNASAYSNMCAAYNQLKQYDKAILAGNEALKLDPNHTLAKGNLKYALDRKK